MTGVIATFAAAAVAAGLFDQLGGPDSELRSGAIDSLAELGRTRIELLAEGLGTTGWRAREGIIDALVKVGEPALPVLMSTARRHPKPDARRLAVRAIGQVGGRAACDSLKALLHSPERDLAAQGLGESGDAPDVLALRPLLSDERPAVRRRAVVAIGKLAGVDEVDRVVAAMQDRDHGVRFAAAEALLEIGPQAIAPLGARLGRMAATSQVLAARTLGRLGDPRAAPYLTSLLISGDWAVRAAAAAALETLGGPDSARLVGQAVNVETHPLAKALMATTVAGRHAP